MTRITAILPAFNEKLSIGSMVIETKKYADRIIVVDDGSTDNTGEIAKLAGVEVIEHSTNKGKGAALKIGFKAAENSDIIVTMDSDGQHDPSDIPKIIAPIINGEADIVNGSRYLNGDKKDTPKYRRVGQTVLDKATNMNIGLNITDSQSGFRAFARHTFPVFKFNSPDFGIESEMLMDASKSGLRIKEVEIGVRYDLNGSTKNPISHGIGVLVRILQDIEFNRPLFYFTLPGFIICIIGITLGLKFFGSYIGGTSSTLLPTVLAVMLTLGGGLFLITGIILDSISKMIYRILDKSNKISPDSTTGQLFKSDNASKTIKNIK